MIPLVSVIIPAQDEDLTACLASLKKQNYKKIEIIVVRENLERSIQRNLGAKKSCGEYLLFLDADMSVAKNLIACCVAKIEKENLAALYLPEKITGNSYWCQVRNFERSFYDGTVIDAVRFIKKNIFQKAGGFDEALTAGEDWDLDKKVRKIGPVALLNNSFLFHHEENFNLLNYLRKKSKYAKSLKDYREKWVDTETQKQFSFGYRYFGVFLENGKWQRFLKSPSLWPGLYFLRFLVGLNHLFKTGIFTYNIKPTVNVSQIFLPVKFKGR
ncbi:glycosyltransferase [Candidatus Gottesmanbacteria bacterium]|nr:glycosyltransferase [Candidatus Gottesmanbacteria bacterium]